jgi:predicted O-methyltransferase YrrM
MGGRMTAFTLDKKLCIEPEFGQLLMETVLISKPKVVVEIGTGQGYSTTWILKGLNANENGIVYTFDSVYRAPFAWDAEGIDRHRAKILPDFRIEDCPDQIDMVFHDSSHFFEEHVQPDLALLIPRMKVGGIICVHDIIHSYEMGEKLKAWFESKPEWKYTENRFGCGMGVAEKVR